VLFIEVDFSLLLGPNKRLALGGSATRRICNGQECEDRPKNHGGVPRSLGFPDGVLTSFGLVISDSRHNQIRAVDGNHAGLDKTRSRVLLLDGGVNTHNRDDDA